MTTVEQSVIPALVKFARKSPSVWLQGVYRLGLFGVATWFLASTVFAVWHFTIDDSGISFAYAKHLARGLGPVAAPGAPWVEGYSNALWVFLLTPLQWLPWPLAQSSKWLGLMMFTSGIATGVWWLAREHGKRLGTAALAALWITLLGSGLEIAVWVVAGLENALLGALLLGLAARERVEREHPERWPWSALLAFGLCITRPEGAMYALPVLALLAWEKRAVAERGGLLRLGLAFLVPLVVYHAVHYSVFHEWVPNTYFAKPQATSFGGGFGYLYKSLRDTGLLYLVPLAVLGASGSLRSKLTLIWYCAAGVVFVVYSGGDWMPFGRFVSFFALPLVLLAMHGVFNAATMVAARVRRWLPQYQELVVESLLLVVFAAGSGLWRGYHAPRVAKEGKAKYCHFCQRSDDAARLQKVSADAGLGRVTVLTHDFGGPAWQSDDSYYPLDFLGLCDASVARIRREQDHMEVGTLLSPYLFHEQPHAPSWIYLPKNFWRRLKQVPEYELGYYSLASRLLPHAPSGSYTSLHRGQLVDYFPPLVNDVSPVTLSASLGLVGAGWFRTSDAPARVEKGTPVRIVLSVVPLTSVRGTETVWVELEGGGRSVKSERVALARGLSGLGSQLRPGEPLRVEVTLTIPELRPKADEPSAVRVLVGSSSGKGRGEVTRREPIAVWTAGTVLGAYSRSAPRFPTGLPAPAAPELVSHEGTVMTAVERQYDAETWHPTGGDRTLAAELHQLGDNLRDGTPDQAYLAYVWATQLDARQWESLTKPLLALRRPIDDAEFALEVTLLREYYSALFVVSTAPAAPTAAAPTPAPSEQPESPDVVAVIANPPVVQSAAQLAAQRLITFYEHFGRGARAEYFRTRSGETPSALPLWIWSQGFEDRKSLDWQGDRKVFSVEILDAKAHRHRRGVEGDGVLSSRKAGDKGKGALTSPPFVVAGTHLSFFFGGGSRDVGVELLVDGAAVRSTSGGDDSILALVWWDIRELVGKSAQIRVFDRSARHTAFLDQVLSWN